MLSLLPDRSTEWREGRGSQRVVLHKKAGRSTPKHKVSGLVGPGRSECLGLKGEGHQGVFRFKSR